jgi:hypothetical protein
MGERTVINIMKLSAWVLLPVLGLATGCIRPKFYRPVGQLTPLKVPPQPDATAPDSIAQKATALPIGTQCLKPEGPQPGTQTPAAEVVDNRYTDSGPCIAFVEYQKSGKRYGRGQMESAEALVQKAIQDDPQHQPIIVGFVHGWKHNANPGNAEPGGTSEWPPEDENIQGFEHVLNFLYRCYYAAPETKSPCLATERSKAPGPVRGHVVVGIYFGWYGANVSPFWPVAQQMTVYSRGGEADHVAEEGDFSEDLKRLSAIAHPIPKPAKEPMFVLVGHSFGARLLEQAIERPMKERIEQQLKAADPGMVPTFADLVLYVNSAAPAKDGMGMLGFLAQHKVVYRKTSGEDRSTEPLLAAITTPADAATGFVFTVAMSPSSLPHGGVETVPSFDPVSGTSFVATEDRRKLYRNTLGHLQEFQSHTVKDVGAVPQAACKDETPGTFADWVPDHCFHVAPATPMEGQKFRWNGTPYWVLSTDQNIIPDHGTIFTNRFLRFIGHILPDEREKAMVTGQWND